MSVQRYLLVWPGRGAFRLDQVNRALIRWRHFRIRRHLNCAGRGDHAAGFVHFFAVWAMFLFPFISMLFFLLVVFVGNSICASFSCGVQQLGDDNGARIHFAVQKNMSFEAAFEVRAGTRPVCHCRTTDSGLFEDPKKYMYVCSEKLSE